MSKQLTAAIVLFLLILCVLPAVSAVSETFTLGKNEVKTIIVELKEGETVRGHITSLGSINATEPNWHQSLIIFKATDPDGTPIDLFNSYWDVALSDSDFGFTAEITGTYKFETKNSVFPDKNQTIALTYNVTPKYGIALPDRLEGLFDILSINGPIILIIFFGVGLLIRFLLRLRAEAENSPIPSPPLNYENCKTNETPSIHNDTPTPVLDGNKGGLFQCKNAWLSETTFYYCRNYYQLSDMAKASVSKYGSLAIRFKNGKTQNFKLAPNEAEMSSVNWNRDTLGSIITTNRYTKKRCEQWAATINDLISKQQSDSMKSGLSRDDTASRP